MRRLRAAAWLNVVGVLMLATPALAASSYTVTPAFQELNLDHQLAVSVQLDLDNNTLGDQVFKLSVVDFGSLNESGGVAFVGSSASDLTRRHGLAAWLKLDTPTVQVAAGKSVTIRASVENSDSLTPGGHYGAILATAQTDAAKAKTAVPQVGVRPVLSSLILLTKSGGGLPELRLVSQTSAHSVVTLPLKFEQRFQNPGNIHVVPRGSVEIKDPFGRVVAHGALNDDSDVILPDSYRRIPVTLVKLASAWMPGKYSVVTSYRYDGTEAIKNYTQTVWYGGEVTVVVCWAVVGLAAAAAGWWLWRHKRRPMKRT